MNSLFYFFEYTLSGMTFLLWCLLWLIFALACLGKVGEITYRYALELEKKKYNILVKKNKEEGEEEREKVSSTEKAEYMADPTLKQTTPVETANIENKNPGNSMVGGNELVILEPQSENNNLPSNTPENVMSSSVQGMAPQTNSFSPQDSALTNNKIYLNPLVQEQNK